MSTGTVIQIIGAVIDVEFPKENLPKIYDALEVEENGLVLEVQQQLGDGIVRTIAMGASEGLWVMVFTNLLLAKNTWSVSPSTKESSKTFIAPKSSSIEGSSPSFSVADKILPP